MKTPRPFVKNYNLKIGDDFSEVITFTGSTTTGWTFEGTATPADGSAAATNLTFVNSTPSVTVSIPDATTANFTAQDYNYVIKITRSTIKKTYFVGVIKVTA